MDSVSYRDNSRVYYHHWYEWLDVTYLWKKLCPKEADHENPLQSTLDMLINSRKDGQGIKFVNSVIRLLNKVN